MTFANDLQDEHKLVLKLLPLYYEYLTVGFHTFKI